MTKNSKIDAIRLDSNEAVMDVDLVNFCVNEVNPIDARVTVLENKEVVGEAPRDSKDYLRRNTAWVDLETGLTSSQTIIKVKNDIINLEDGLAGKGFINLPDTPDTYVGNADKIVTVNGLENGLTFTSAKPLIESFINLTDTPSAYKGNEGKYPQVNPTGTGLIFGGNPGGDVDGRFPIKFDSYVSAGGGTRYDNFYSDNSFVTKNCWLYGSGESTKGLDNGLIFSSYRESSAASSGSNTITQILHADNGKMYTRKGSMSHGSMVNPSPWAWQPWVENVSGFVDATKDTKLYGRRDGQWAEIVIPTPPPPPNTVLPHDHDKPQLGVTLNSSHVGLYPIVNSNLGIDFVAPPSSSSNSMIDKTPLDRDFNNYRTPGLYKINFTVQINNPKVGSGKLITGNFLQVSTFTNSKALLQELMDYSRLVIAYRYTLEDGSTWDKWEFPYASNNTMCRDDLTALQDLSHEGRFILPNLLTDAPPGLANEKKLHVENISLDHESQFKQILTCPKTLKVFTRTRNGMYPSQTTSWAEEVKYNNQLLDQPADLLSDVSSPGTYRAHRYALTSDWPLFDNSSFGILHVFSNRTQHLITDNGSMFSRVKESSGYKDWVNFNTIYTPQNGGNDPNTYYYPGIFYIKPTYSPHQWPTRIGEGCILNVYYIPEDNNGICQILTSTISGKVYNRKRLSPPDVYPSEWSEWIISGGQTSDVPPGGGTSGGLPYEQTVYKNTITTSNSGVSTVHFQNEYPTYIEHIVEFHCSASVDYIGSIVLPPVLQAVWKVGKCVEMRNFVLQPKGDTLIPTLGGDIFSSSSPYIYNKFKLEGLNIFDKSSKSIVKIVLREWK